MINKVKDFILKKLNINQSIVCAVSGGADSVALIYILNKLGYKCILAHVNHHKRIESEMEEKEMRNYAKALNVPFEVLEYHFDGNDNFHNDSHNARYNFFREICDKYNTNIIATAHHEDDEIETILIKLMEGSNLYGYGGISVCNDDGKYKIIRPLLCLSKNDIYKFVSDNHLKYFEDSSNAEDDFLRNRLRHHIIPKLKEECPSLGDMALRYSLLLHESFDYIRQNSISYLKANNGVIILDSFNTLHIALKKDIIAYMCEQYSVRKNTKIIDNILSILSESCGNKEIRLENDYIFVKEYNKAYIKEVIYDDFEQLELNLDDMVIFKNKYKFYFSKNINRLNAKHINLCYNQLKLPLIIRNKKDGDFIKIENGTKKLSRIFIDKKVPKNERANVPVICDKKNNILWVFDYAKSDDIYSYKETGDIYLVCEVIE
ncbi:MAG: tRNA lysidine(34) synthetase TilS [Acholeplasmatales bacterium]|nr:tRNA lysidine(34) synthetase TilS [Acholeplasmatales bacterium]